MRRTAQEVERREHSENTLGKRVHILDAFGGIVTEGNMAMVVVESAPYTYIAVAQIGSAQEDAVWQVKRIDESVGVVIKWADGDDLFDNPIDDITNLDYL